MLREAFGEYSSSQTAALEWHSCFKDGQVLAEDDKDQQNDRKCWKIQEVIHNYHHRTIHKLTDTTEISYGVCQEILTENLNVHRNATEFVPPRHLSNDQKRWCKCILSYERS
jgi:hypothetical protein